MFSKEYHDFGMVLMYIQCNKEDYHLAEALYKESLEHILDDHDLPTAGISEGDTIEKIIIN
jgi:hypothetical protein